jgi:DNA helicase-2/ATP-dependent DNA helicase PcrA
MAGDLLEGLNEDQRAVALCGDNAVVVAGPGSGKSTTLARKAALVLSDPGRRLAAVTFTREAAFELRERVVRYAGMDAAPRLLVGTFHSVMQLQSFPKMRKGNFSAEIIDGAKSGFGRKPWDIVKPGVWRQYVARAMADVGVDADIEFEDAVKIIEWVKSGKAPQERIHEQLVKSYTEIMARNHVIDFQDILLKTIEGLKEGNVSPLNVTDLFIDEYQDTDDIQFQWGREHFKANIRMTAVGDDDQSIYAFRNALGYQGMLRKGVRGENAVARAQLPESCGDSDIVRERYPQQPGPDRQAPGVQQGDGWPNEVADVRVAQRRSFRGCEPCSRHRAGKPAAG